VKLAWIPVIADQTCETAPPWLYILTTFKSARPQPAGMETRKVQVTGGSTYTVSIPKSWATENDVGAGSEVEFYPDGDSLLRRRNEPVAPSTSPI